MLSISIVDHKRERDRDIWEFFSYHYLFKISLISGRSPQTTSGQSLTTPEKNITLPRSTTLSGQSKCTRM